MLFCCPHVCGYRFSAAATRFNERDVRRRIGDVGLEPSGFVIAKSIGSDRVELRHRRPSSQRLGNPSMSPGLSGNVFP